MKLLIGSGLLAFFFLFRERGRKKRNIWENGGVHTCTANYIHLEKKRRNRACHKADDDKLLLLDTCEVPQLSCWSHGFGVPQPEAPREDCSLAGSFLGSPCSSALLTGSPLGPVKTRAWNWGTECLLVFSRSRPPRLTVSHLALAGELGNLSEAFRTRYQQQAACWAVGISASGGGITR